MVWVQLPVSISQSNNWKNMKQFCSLFCLALILLQVGCGSPTEDGTAVSDVGVRDTESSSTAKMPVEEVKPENSSPAELQEKNDEQGWGHLSGQIFVEGGVPPAARIVLGPNNNGCFKNGQQLPANEDLVVGKDGGLRDAFVMMYLKRGEDRPSIHPEYAAENLKPVLLDNKNCVFAPHAMIIRVGQKLQMKNSDEVGHNCHGIFFKDEYNYNIPIGETVEHEFKESEKVPGNVVCDIHPWMNAVMLIREEPYAAITDELGKFQIKNIPAGKWTFQFWHKKVGYMRDLKVPGVSWADEGKLRLKLKTMKIWI